MASGSSKTSTWTRRTPGTYCPPPPEDSSPPSARPWRVGGFRLDVFRLAVVSWPIIESIILIRLYFRPPVASDLTPDPGHPGGPARPRRAGPPCRHPRRGRRGGLHARQLHHPRRPRPTAAHPLVPAAEVHTSDSGRSPSPTSRSPPSRCIGSTTPNHRATRSGPGASSSRSPRSSPPSPPKTTAALVRRRFLPSSSNRHPGPWFPG
jgi:hypothetical protein